jgi:Leucine-rich repeat (LRR) protein
MLRIFKFIYALIKYILIGDRVSIDQGDKKVVPSDDFRVSIPDENFREYLLEEHGIENDGATLAYGDAKEIKEIRCEGRKIQSLEGIQFFTALDHLECPGPENELTSLDVSRNTALTKLWCDFNQLANLDVSHNNALTELNCNRNQLTTLDLSQNNALEFLECENNQLTNLDLSNNPSLKEVALKGNTGYWW